MWHHLVVFWDAHIVFQFVSKRSTVKMSITVSNFLILFRSVKRAEMPNPLYMYMYVTDNPWSGFLKHLEYICELKHERGNGCRGD